MSPALRSAFAAALLAAGPVLATPLSLPDAIAAARDLSPALSSARARARAASDRARAASFFWAPDLALDSAWDRTEVPARAFAQKLDRGEFRAEDFALDKLNAPGFDANLETTVGLRLPVDVFGAGRSGRDAAEAAARAEEARVGAAEADLETEVIGAYFGILEADRAVAAAEKSLEASRELERTVAARRDAGAALEADVLRVRTRRRDREVGAARARSGAELARSRLRVLLGWKPDAAIELSSAPGAPAERLPLEAWLTRADAGSPELAAARAGAEAAAADARGARAAGRPALQLFGGWQDDRNRWTNGRGSATVELRLHWSVWDPARRSRNAAASEAARSADENRRAAVDAVHLSVESRWRDLDVARIEADAARDGLREADEVFRVSRERWEAGRTPLVDLLDAESGAASAAASDARASVRVAIAAASLERAAGKR